MNEKMSGHYQCTAHNLFGTATITYVISYTQPGRYRGSIIEYVTDLVGF